MARIYLSLVALTFLAACGNDAPTRASVIEPVFVEACRFTECSDHGECTAQSDGSPSCLCEVGYGGAQCQRCEAGFHRDSKERCAPDRLCSQQTTNPCGLHGSCDDRQGVIACHCDPGYEGPRCNLCMSGYGRDEFGECLQLVISDGDPTPTKPVRCTPDVCNRRGDCDDATGQAVCTCDPGYALPDCAACAAGFHQDGPKTCVMDEVCATNPISRPSRLDFDSLSTFPEFENNCVSGVSVDTADLTLTSIEGDGEVWACAKNTLYDLTTHHVFLEAGSLGPAQLIFSGEISQLSFDYGARSALSLEVLADGKAVSSLTAARRTQGSQMYTFDPAAKLIEFRSVNGSTNQIGIDNIAYVPPVCR